MAVLEGEDDAEVAFQRAADGVAGQRPQELPAGLLVGGRHLVVDERPVGGAGGVLGHEQADRLPRVGQGRPDAIDEGGFVNRAPFGGCQQVGGDIERHERLLSHENALVDGGRSFDFYS